MKSGLAILALATSAQGAFSIKPDVDAYADLGVKILRSVTEGMNLYEHVERLSVCDFDTDNFFRVFLGSVGTFMEPELDSFVVRKGIFTFTDSLGLSSYAIRSCYAAQMSAGELYKHYIEQFGSFPEAASDFHNNIIASALDLNAQGWTSYVGFYTGRYEDFAFGISRSIYLTLLQTHFTSYKPSTKVRKLKEGNGHLTPQEAQEVRIRHTGRMQREQQTTQEGHPKVETVYPFPKITFNNFHYGLELLYEFIRGARVVPKVTLDVCETRITNYMLNLANARDYIDLGILLEDKDIIIEGYFRVFDTFLLLTDLSRGCWGTYWRIGKSLNYLIAVNVLSEKQVFMNLISEYFLLANNLTTFMADYFFSDWLSFAYYAGDTIYRLVVAQNQVEFDWKTYS